MNESSRGKVAFLASISSLDDELRDSKTYMLETIDDSCMIAV